MRILHVVWGFTGGGVDKVVESYVKMSRTYSFESKIVCLHAVDWKTDTAKLDYLGADRICFTRRCSASWVLDLNSYIKQYEPTLVFAHGFNSPVAVTLTSLFRKSRPVLICSYHGRYHSPSARKKPLEFIFNNSLEYIYKRFAKAVLAVSEESEAYLIKKGVQPSKITVVHNGLPSTPEYFNHISREKFQLSASDIVLGTTSRLAPEKGLRYLILAFAIVYKRYANIKLLIVGDGPQRNELKAMVQELGLNRVVIFAGYIPDASACLFVLDVFVLPSLHEYHSIALLEAMRAERPIIATSVGGNAESVRHLIEAVLVLPGNIDQLAAAISKIIEDKGFAINLGRNAKRRFELKFSESAMHARTYQWLQNLLVDL